jgi:hypothetical protein
VGRSADAKVARRFPSEGDHETDDPPRSMTDDSPAELCTEHRCCIRVPRVETSPEFSHLAGEWHLMWMPDDSAWFLAPPQGNVWEIRVTGDADATGELAVDGVIFDDIRRAIDQKALFPPC